MERGRESEENLQGESCYPSRGVQRAGLKADVERENKVQKTRARQSESCIFQLQVILNRQ